MLLETIEQLKNIPDGAVIQKKSDGKKFKIDKQISDRFLGNYVGMPRNTMPQLLDNFMAQQTGGMLYFDDIKQSLDWYYEG